MKRTHRLSLSVSTGDQFDVRWFEVTEGLHELFRIEIEAVSGDPDIDFDTIMGQSARFLLQRAEGMPTRFWDGLVTSIRRVGIEQDHLSTYRVVIQPRLWLLTQSRNYRIFQHMSDPDIAASVLRDWGLEVRSDYAADQFKGRKYRVQYAESDLRFMRRLLEDAGVTFLFEQGADTTELVFVDGPQARAPRANAVHYENSPSGELLKEVATNVQVARQVRPGRYTQRDVDYRRPADFPLLASKRGGTEVETALERFHHNYGAFLFSAEPDGSTPNADDRGAARTDLALGEEQVSRRLAAKRHDAHRCSFETTAHDLAPGVVFSFQGFPARDLASDVQLLVVKGRITGRDSGEWLHEVDAFFANQPYHPPLATPKPQTRGVESATVVGGEDDEIHTDEFARVRVQFHWDREGGRDDSSSCWIPVSQPWGGASFGAVNIPRIGQEVLIDFLGADPDRPVVIGRVFTKTQPVPYALPKFKTISGIRSQSAYRMVMGANDGVMTTPSIPEPGEAPVRMDMARLQDAIQGAGAGSPTGDTHRWNGSEVTFDDQFGRELFYMQAENNLSMVVKNNMATVVGGGRTGHIGMNDALTVDGNQTLNVMQNRTVFVNGAQTRVVLGDIEQHSVEGNQTFTTCEKLSSEAKHHELTSAETVKVEVGASTLFMAEDFVILQTPFLFLNPGAEATRSAIESGQRPLTPEELAAELREAAVQARMAELTEAYNEGRARNYFQLQQEGRAGEDSSIFNEAVQRWDDQHRPAGWGPPDPSDPWSMRYHYDPPRPRVHPE